MSHFNQSFIDMILGGLESGTGQIRFGKKPELERIVNRLIRKTKWDMKWAFLLWRLQYSTRKMPIGEEEAAHMMRNLLRLASARRELLNERIVKSAESGAVHKRYHYGLDMVNEADINVKRTKRQLHQAKRDQEFARAKYEEIRDLTYSVQNNSSAQHNSKKGGGNP